MGFNTEGSQKPAKQVRVWIPNSLLYCIAKKNISLSVFVEKAVISTLEDE